MEDMCAFYDAMKEYKNITARDTNNTTKALKLAMNETYNDSCSWVSKKGHKNTVWVIEMDYFPISSKPHKYHRHAKNAKFDEALCHLNINNSYN